MEIHPGNKVSLTLSEADWITRPFYVTASGALDPGMSDVQRRVEDARVTVVREAMAKHGLANFSGFDKDENGNERPVVETELTSTELLSILGMAECRYREQYAANMDEASLTASDDMPDNRPASKGTRFEKSLKEMQVTSGIVAAIRNAQEEG